MLGKAMPLFLLLGQIYWVHHDLLTSRRVRPHRVPDSESYLVLSRKQTVEGALTHYRTYGYAFLLRIFGWKEIPGRELWIFFFGVICFFFGASSYARSAWLGLAAASPLPSSSSAGCPSWAGCSAPCASAAGAEPPFAGPPRSPR